MRLRGIFLGVAAAALGAVMAHDVDARGKSGGAARSSMSTGAHTHHAHHGSFPQRHFHSSFVAVGVGVPFYSYPGSYYPGYYYPGYASPPPPPPGWYFCPAYNAYYPASVPCPSYGPPAQGYAPAPPQMYGAPPDAYGVPPDYVPPQ